MSAPGRALDVTRFHTGTSSLAVTASDLGELAVFQDVSVIAESGYTASGWIATQELDTGRALLELLWLTAEGLGDSLAPTDILGTVPVGELGNTTDWTQVEGSFTAPAGAMVARFQMRVEQETDGIGFAWFDDDSLAGLQLPDVTPPTVTIIAPQPGEVVSTPTTVSAEAGDDGAVAGVQFRANGVDLGEEVTSPPYEVVLNTDTLPDGPIDLEASARDTAGNTALSAAVTVIVHHPVVPRKNIVLILSDDQRANTMSWMPLTMSLLGTPGVQFVNAIANTPLCCPARATILTGLYTHNHGVRTNSVPLGGGAPAFHDSSTIATWLQAAGYRTALIGKYLNGYEQLRPWPYTPPGWSYWAAFKMPGYSNYRLVENSAEVFYGSGSVNYSTTLLASKAVSFINSTPINQPLFLMFTPFAPHGPATPASQDKNLFGGMPKFRPPSFNETDVSDKPLWIQQTPRLTTSQISSQVDAFRISQRRSLQSLDRGVRDIVNALAATGRLNNSVIIYASDNGLSWGEHRVLTKNCVYDGCIRVPLIVLAPSVTPRIDSSLVMLADLAPSIAEWAGVTPPMAVNGTSIAGLMKNPGVGWRSEVLLEVLERHDPATTEGLFVGLRTLQYTYAEYTTGERELYDMKVDPHQLTNIAGNPANAALIAELSATLAGLRAQ